MLLALPRISHTMQLRLPLARLRAVSWSATRCCSASAAPTAPPLPATPPAPGLGIDLAHPRCNVPASLLPRISRGLHRDARHPLGQLAARIRAHFASGRASADGRAAFAVFDALPPVVTVAQNFDELLTPAEHVSRAPSDTFYVDAQRLLRCHMTAHQTTLLRGGERRFLMVGDVFRRDEIDATHFPVFHQLDGVRLFSPEELAAAAGGDAGAQRAHVLADLRFALEGMTSALFGAAAQRRWVEASFPFTAPSLEMEVLWEGRWLEVLGCGEIRPEILARCGLAPGARGWAFGCGLERLAMVLFGIPDIRLFWSDDARFTEQFAGGAAPGLRFKPYSRQPPCLKDVTFWLPPAFHDNDLFDLIRGEAGDVVEDVRRTDEFAHPRSGRVSRCYRITYRDMARTLTNAEVDAIQARVRTQIVSKLGGELR